jgi:hypothetical protein
MPSPVQFVNQIGADEPGCTGIKTFYRHLRSEFKPKSPGIAADRKQTEHTPEQQFRSDPFSNSRINLRLAWSPRASAMAAQFWSAFQLFSPFDPFMTIFQLMSQGCWIEVTPLVHEPDSVVATITGSVPAGTDAGKGGLVWLFGLGGHRKVPAFC